MELEKSVSTMKEKSNTLINNFFSIQISFYELFTCDIKITEKVAITSFIISLNSILDEIKYIIIPSIIKKNIKM